MAEASNKRRLDLGQARGRAAKACGVDASELGEATEHGWGWSFVLASGGTRVFVDGGTGLSALSEPDDDEERLAALQERGPLGVPPWSPLPKRRGWQDVFRALGKKWKKTPRS